MSHSTLQKLVQNAQIKNSNATFYVIFKHCEIVDRISNHQLFLWTQITSRGCRNDRRWPLRHLQTLEPPNAHGHYTLWGILRSGRQRNAIRSSPGTGDEPDLHRPTSFAPGHHYYSRCAPLNVFHVWGMFDDHPYKWGFGGCFSLSWCFCRVMWRRIWDGSLFLSLIEIMRLK